MKAFVLFSMALMVSLSATAQMAPVDTAKINFNLESVSNRQCKVAKIGLSSLVTWGIGNIAVSGYMQSRTTGQQQYFHKMNVYFNVVNVALGGLGLLDAYKQRSISFEKVYKRQQEIEKIYLFNSALDLSYVAVGWGLLNLSESKTGEDRFLNAGYGNSMVLQGSFLFVYDLVLLAVHKRNNTALDSFWSKMELSDRGIGLKIKL